MLATKPMLGLFGARETLGRQLMMTVVCECRLLSFMH